MDRAIQSLTARNLDACGIRHFASVVIGDVAGMPVYQLRLQETARSLLTRPTGNAVAGRTGNKRPRPVDASDGCAFERFSSDVARNRSYWCPGRPRSAIRRGGF